MVARTSYTILCQPIWEPMLLFTVAHELQKQQAGYALVSASEVAGVAECATIWHIYIDPKQRRKGYATALIAGLQHKFQLIVTGATTKEGRELCLACGFKLEVAMFRNQEDRLIWRKEPDSAKGTGAEAQTGGGGQRPDGQAG